MFVDWCVVSSCLVAGVCCLSVCVVCCCRLTVPLFVGVVVCGMFVVCRFLCCVGAVRWCRCVLFVACSVVIVGGRR